MYDRASRGFWVLYLGAKWVIREDVTRMTHATVRIVFFWPKQSRPTGLLIWGTTERSWILAIAFIVYLGHTMVRHAAHSNFMMTKQFWGSVWTFSNEEEPEKN